MKLLYCRSCHDVVALRVGRRRRRCECGRSWGRYYVGGGHAEAGGCATLLGLSNGSLARHADRGNQPGEEALECWTLSSDPATEPSLTLRP